MENTAVALFRTDCMPFSRGSELARRQGVTDDYDADLSPMASVVRSDTRVLALTS